MFAFCPFDCGRRAAARKATTCATATGADICEISTELEVEENLDPQPRRHVDHHRRGRLRRQLSEAHRHPSPTVLSHQRDWPGRDVGVEQCRGTVRPACGTCAALLQSLGRPGCSGRRNCNVNLDELRGDRPDLDCEPEQAGDIPPNLQLDETTVWGRKMVVAAVVFLLLLRVPVWGVVVLLLTVVGCCLGMWWGQWARGAERWRGLANRCRRFRGWPSLPSLRASASTSASATLGRLMAISCPLSARCPHGPARP